MRVLALSSYPVQAAATRFRIEQFIKPLAGRDVELELSPFLSKSQFAELYRSGTVAKGFSLLRSFATRLSQTGGMGRYDVLLVQREAMIFGPGFFEWLYRMVGRVPMVLDLDDATYVPYVSPTYGRVGSFFKFFGKTDGLIESSELVICGNRFIAEYVNSKGRKSIVIPTVVDESVFHPIEKNNAIPVIGWIGTHSTYPFLETLFPVLTELAKKHHFKLKIVGSGRDDVSVPGVDVENTEWRLEREVSDFQELDIGLYPIETGGSLDSQWLLGKSGFKAIQYMAVGVPFVVTPVGVCAEIGTEGVTHFNATSPEDWYDRLNQLLDHRILRINMGRAARAYSVDHYSLSVQAELIAETLKGVRDNFAARERS